MTPFSGPPYTDGLSLMHTHFDPRHGPTDDPAGAAASLRRRIYLAAEFVALFLGLPLLLYAARDTLANHIISTLLVLAAGCVLYLLMSPQFDRSQFWDTAQLRRHMRPTLVNFFVGAGGLTVAVVVFSPELLLSFPREQTSAWLVLLVSYPILSVYPQEIIFRAFLFHRYRVLFPSSRARIGASGVAFSLAHLVFANWVAPLITLAGGVLFARTYSRSGSLLLVGIEHVLWGLFVFTVGLGWYLYGAHII